MTKEKFEAARIRLDNIATLEKQIALLSQQSVSASDIALDIIDDNNVIRIMTLTGPIREKILKHLEYVLSVEQLEFARL